MCERNGDQHFRGMEATRPQVRYVQYLILKAARDSVKPNHAIRDVYSAHDFWGAHSLLQ